MSPKDSGGGRICTCIYGEGHSLLAKQLSRSCEAPGSIWHFSRKQKVCSMKKESFQPLPVLPITGKAKKGLKCHQELCKVKLIPEIFCGDQQLLDTWHGQLSVITRYKFS